MQLNPPSSDPRLILTQAGAVAILTLARPEKANAYTLEMLRALKEQLQSLAASTEIRAVLLTSLGRHFCAGADLQELSARGAVDALPLLAAEVFEGLRRLPCPTVAAMRGAALGGGFELALACDVRVVADDVRAALPELRRGVLPAAGGIRRLVQLVGGARARSALLTGGEWDGPTLLANGLAIKLCSVEMLDREALVLAQSFAQLDPIACRLAKLALAQAEDGRPSTELEQVSQALLYTLASSRASV